MSNLIFEGAFKPSPQATVREVCNKMEELNEWWLQGERSALHTDVYWDGDCKMLRVEKRLYL